MIRRGLLRVCICGAYDTETINFKVELLKALADHRYTASVSVETAGPKLELDTDLNHAPDAVQIVLLLGLEAGNGPAYEADQAIRGKLGRARQPFEVLYGSNQERLAQALELIKRQSPDLHRSPGQQGKSAIDRPDPAPRRPWAWQCDKCSDPVCEHRLLTDLLTARQSSARKPTY